MIKLLCFDLDGTLIDSAGDIATAVNRTLADHDKDPLPYPVIVSHIGEGLKVLLSGIFTEVRDPNAQEDLVEAFLMNYERVMLQTTKVYPQVFEFIRDWVGRGGKIGLITNKNERPTRIIMDHLGLMELPWVAVFGADTLEERKPSPLPLNRMMELAGVTKNETLMIGDGLPDVKSAQAAGVASIACGYGYTDLRLLENFSPRASLSEFAQLAKTLSQFETA